MDALVKLETKSDNTWKKNKTVMTCTGIRLIVTPKLELTISGIREQLGAKLAA